jgi:transcriptional regulator with XRE-family HTH domain
MKFPRPIARGGPLNDAAGRAGLSLRSVQNWEQGHGKPKADALLALSGPLNVPVETLVALVAGQAAPPPSPKGRGKGKPRGKHSGDGGASR